MAIEPGGAPGSERHITVHSPHRHIPEKKSAMIKKRGIACHIYFNMIIRFKSENEFSLDRAVN